MKKVLAMLLCLLTLSSSSALADAQKTKQIYSSIPVYDENGAISFYRQENNDTLYYQFSSNTSCSCSMRIGSVKSKTVSGGKLTVKFSSSHSEKGYCPSWSNTISYSGTTSYSSSTSVSR